MIVIRLTNGYYIEQEGRDHVLKQMYETQPKGKYKNQAPRESTRDIGYFSNLESALERYLLLVQSEEGHGLVLPIKEYVDAVKQINEYTVKQIIASRDLMLRS